MVLLFDDAKKLEKAVGEEAAEVIAHVLEKHNEQSKQDLEKAKSELPSKADILALKADILATEGNLKAEIYRLEGQMDAKIQAAKSETIKWMAGMLMVQAATVAALVKLLG